MIKSGEGRVRRDEAVHSPPTPVTTQPEDEQDRNGDADSDTDSSSVRQAATSSDSACE